MIISLKFQIYIFILGQDISVEEINCLWVRVEIKEKVERESREEKVYSTHLAKISSVGQGLCNIPKGIICHSREKYKSAVIHGMKIICAQGNHSSMMSYPLVLFLSEFPHRASERVICQYSPYMMIQSSGLVF